MEIKNLTKKYGQNCVYENFNLTVNEGEVTCILGESGSGKTTLLNCIANLTEYGGEIDKKICAYVFQTPRLVANLTVLKNLQLICGDAQKTEEMLVKLKIDDKKNSYPCELSGGQAQRVSLARAFLYGGDMILLDEPFSSLDLKLKREISTLFCGLQKEYDKTALFVTHDVDEALQAADRIIVICGGKIIQDLSPKTCENARVKLISALIGA